MTQNQLESAKPRQSRAIKTRQKICEAAIRILGRNGARAVTHRAVAERAGVSLASTTYHFKDKAELLAEAFTLMIDVYTDKYRGKLDAAIKGASSTHLSPLDALTNYLVSVSRQNIDSEEQRYGTLAWYEFMVEASRNKKLQQLASNWYDETSAHYQLILERFGSRTPHEDARRVVDFLIGYECVLMALDAEASREAKMKQTYRRLVESMFDND